MAVVAHLRLTYTPEVEKKVLSLMREASAILKRQDGFLDLVTYRCLEDNELLGFIHWESLEHHEACQRNPEWFMLMPDWSELLEDEAVQLAITFCECL